MTLFRLSDALNFSIQASAHGELLKGKQDPLNLLLPHYISGLLGRSVGI